MNIEEDFKDLKELIVIARSEVIKSVNTQLIDLYWSIGKYISIKVESSERGKFVVKSLADYLRNNLVESKGFSSQNLLRMK